MASELAWLLVVAGGACAILLASRLALQLSPAWPPLSARRSRSAAGGGVLVVLVVLVVLCFLLKIPAFARADADAVSLLARTRSAGLVGVFSVVTTLGDVVPTLLIGASLGIYWHVTTREIANAFALPLAVTVEVALQFVFGDLFRDPTIAQVRGDLVLGGAGPIPSGSMARLLTVFLLAAFLWAGQDERMSKRLMTVGCVLTLIELVSRLYLGRHFLTDIVGGLLLGVVLTAAGSWLIRGLSRVSTGVSVSGQGGARHSDPR